MDSSIPPPPPSRSAVRLRPWYLVAAMVMTWFIGLSGLTTGWATAKLLRDGTLPDVAAALHAAQGSGTMADFGALLRAAEISARLTHASVTFPISVAQALLGGLLVVASSLAMSGRRGARALALQAILATAVLMAVDFALTRGVRGAVIDALVTASGALPPGAPARDRFGDAGALWWAMRMVLVIRDLGPLALAALALTRARTKTFFDAVARAAESAEEP